MRPAAASSRGHTTAVLLGRLLVPAGLVLAWQVAVWLLAPPPWILPGPLAVLRALVAGADVLLPALAVTLLTTLAALLVAAAGGFLLGLAIALSRTLEYALLPLAVTLQVVPLVAVAPIILLYVERVETALVLCAALVAFFPMLANTLAGLERAREAERRLFALYGASRWQELIHLRLPRALPFVLAGLRIAATLALVGAVVAEFAAGTAGSRAGLAYRILESGWRLETARMYAALLLLAVAGLVLYGLVGALERRVLRRLHLERAGA